MQQIWLLILFNKLIYLARHLQKIKSRRQFYYAKLFVRSAFMC